MATHAHTLSETMVGAAAGALAALIALHGLRTQRLPLARTAVVGALLLCFLVLWTSQRPLLLPTERWLARAGAHLAGREAPVSKREWLRTGQVVDQQSPH